MLGDELYRRRVAAGLTQEELADRAEIDRTYVSKLERGIQSPTVDMLIRVCHAMGAKASDVLAAVEGDHRIAQRKRR
jgi:transcriptional regulator with XRE-family HTH domain